MRQSWSDLELIGTSDDAICGISLGYDYCAEHERGHASMGQALGVGHAGTSGLEQFLSKAIDAQDPRMVLYERAKATKTIAAETRLIFHTNARTSQELAAAKPNDGRLPAISVENGKSNRPLYASWNSDGFCIRAFGDDERDTVRRIHAALIQEDLMISSAASANPFGRGGLCLTILSAVHQSDHDSFAAAEDDARRLASAASATGIETVLKTSGRTHRALQARWSHEMKTVLRNTPEGDRKPVPRPKSAHPVIFFLNPAGPAEQSGWYTVEELEAWCRGEGPVLTKSNRT